MLHWSMSTSRVNSSLAPTQQHQVCEWTGCKYRFSKSSIWSGWESNPAYQIWWREFKHLYHLAGKKWKHWFQKNHVISSLIIIPQRDKLFSVSLYFWQKNAIFYIRRIYRTSSTESYWTLKLAWPFIDFTTCYAMYLFERLKLRSPQLQRPCHCRHYIGSSWTVHILADQGLNKNFES